MERNDKDAMEMEYLGDVNMGDFEPEPEPIFFGIGPWKISYIGFRRPSFAEKMDMWWTAFRGEMLRFAMIFFALGSVFFSGYTFGSKVHAPVVNATMAEVEKPGSGAWAPAGAER